MRAYSIYSQRDPRWKDIPIGESKLTIGGYGCLITAIGMMLGEDPVSAHNKLVQAGLIGYPTCLACLNSFYVERAWPRQVETVYISRRFPQPVPDNELNKLISHLASEEPAIVEVDIRPQTRRLDQHFVLAVGMKGDLIIVHDPWIGEKISLTPRYGKTNAQAVWRFILYRLAS